MINYGNSKALVHVDDASMDNRIWGQTGTVIEGQPLAIEYNKDVFNDQPAA
jgi:hypothetical protein